MTLYTKVMSAVQLPVMKIYGRSKNLVGGGVYRQCAWTKFRLLVFRLDFAVFVHSTNLDLSLFFLYFYKLLQTKTLIPSYSVNLDVNFQGICKYDLMNTRTIIKPFGAYTSGKCNIVYFEEYVSKAGQKPQVNNIT